MALYKGLVPKIMRLGPGNNKSSYTDIKIVLLITKYLLKVPFEPNIVLLGDFFA